MKRLDYNGEVTLMLFMFMWACLAVLFVLLSSLRGVYILCGLAIIGFALGLFLSSLEDL